MPVVLFVTYPWHGHVIALLGTARRLLAMGWEVAWTTPQDVWGVDLSRTRRRIVASGVRLLPPMPMAIDPRPPGVSLAMLGESPELYRSVLAASLVHNTPREVEYLCEVISAERVELIVSDGQLASVPIAASLSGLRWVQVSSALHLCAPDVLESIERSVLRSLALERRELYARYGMAPEFRYEEIVVSPWLNTVFACREFVGDIVLPGNTHLVGPYVIEEDEVELSIPGDRPLIYVAWGTMLEAGSVLLDQVIEAALELDAAVVVAAGARAAELERRWGGRAIVVEYAPQKKLLERARVFVCHAGSNSVMEALVRGVPMLLFPKYFDTPIQGWFVTRSGAGIVVESPPVSMRDVLAELLSEESIYRRSVEAIARAYRARDGAAESAELIRALREG